MTSVFQPIVDLQRLVITGYEALIRFDLASHTPDLWFAAAAARGLVPELEALSIRSAARHRPDLPPNCFMSVNVEPESVVHPTLWSTLDSLGDLRGIVVEITEHRALASMDQLEPVLDRLRGAGALIAIDDTGAGHAGLQQILTLRPSILKLDKALVEHVDTDRAKAALIEMIGTFANRIDAWLLAEGVETEAEARMLVDLGVPLVQGYYFGRPAAPWTRLDPMADRALRPRTAALSSSGLRGLLDPAPWIRTQDQHTARQVFAGPSDTTWCVVVDEDARPVGLLSPTSAMDDEVLAPLVANVVDAPAEVAHRLAVRDGDHPNPVVVVDANGRYIGIVTVPRLLQHLATLAS